MLAAVKRVATAIQLALLISCQTGHSTPTPLSDEFNEQKILPLFSGLEAYDHMLREIPEHESERPETDSGTPSNRELLGLLRDEDSPGYGSEGAILIQRGVRAQNDIIAEFRDAKGYYLLNLVTVLSEIPTRQRDEAFCRKLTSLLGTSDDFLLRSYVPAMMRALARRGSMEAIPILQRYVEDARTPPDVCAEARICLNLLGKPMLLSNAPEYYALAEQLAKQGQDPNVDRALCLLETLLNHQLIGAQGRLRVDFVKHDGSGPTTIGGGFTDRGGAWSLGIGRPVGNRTGVCYSWMTGPLASAEYAGIVERRNTGSLVVYWEMLWQS